MSGMAWWKRNLERQMAARNRAGGIVRHPQAMGLSLSDLKYTIPVYGVPLLIYDSATGQSPFNGPSEAGCAQNREKATAGLDAQTLDLAANWKPTGFYQIADMVKMRDATMATLADASAAVTTALDRPLTYKATLTMALSNVQRKMTDSLPFTNAIGEAQKRGIRVIDSPGFKRWVIDSLNAASNAMGHVAYMACIKPALVSLVEKAYQLWRTVVAIGKAMVRIVVAAGEQFLRIPDTLGTIWTVTKWGTLAVGAAWLLTKLKKPG